MIRLVLTLGFALALSACAQSPSGANLPARAFDSTLQGKTPPVLLDIRTPQEFASGHIAGARLVDFYAPDFAAQLQKLPRDKPVLLYCRSGNRSGQALRQMQAMGFTQVRHLEGGILSWNRAGLPLR